MRNQALAFLFFLLAVPVLSARAGEAPPQHGGPDSDPTSDFDSTASVDTYEGREQTLLPLAQLISDAERAVLDATRAENTARLEQFVQRGAFESPRVDLRARDTEVKKQFGGTCTAFGLMAAMENFLGGKVDLSERHFWSEYHQYSCEAAITAASTSWGVVDLDWWPDNHNHPYYGYMDQPWYKLTKYESLDGDITKAVASLAAGNPVYIAVSTPADMMNCPVHIDPNTGHYKQSGHALAVVGYELDPSVPGGGSFLLKNSWGTSCGDKGYQWYPFNLCTKDGMYCQFWSIQGVSHD
jgi:hypothetical protein